MDLDSNFEFWRKWFVIANIFTVLVGLLVAFAGNSVFFELHNNFTREIFFGGEPIAGKMLAFKNWLFGIIGGTIVGFHILMILIANNSFKRKEKWAYWACWLGLLSWFFIDSGISTFYGAFYNVYLINLVALVAIGIPLVFTYSAIIK